MKWILFLCCVALAVVAVACKGSRKSAEFQSVSASAFETLLEKDGVQLLDVRTQEEYSDGHIPGALHLDVLQDSFAVRADSMLDKDREVLVYCRSGKRSKKAASLLAGRGFRVTDLSGGFTGWVADGKPAVR